MDTGPFPGVKSGRGVTLTPHPLLVPWSWEGRAIPLLPLWAVRPVQSLSACTRVHFTLPQCLYKGELYLTSVPVHGCTLPLLLYTVMCATQRQVTYIRSYIRRGTFSTTGSLSACLHNGRCNGTGSDVMSVFLVLIQLQVPLLLADHTHGVYTAVYPHSETTQLLCQ